LTLLHDRFHGRSLLEKCGLRATRQRLGLANLLFGKGQRHVTVDALAAEARAVNISLSLATIYNVLNRFAQLGLVRELPIEGSRTVFDTNTSDHSHFFFEDTHEVRDLNSHPVALDQIRPPEGFEIVRVDVVARLRRKRDVMPSN